MWHLVKDIFIWKTKSEFEHENCTAYFHSFGKWEALGGKKGNWQTLSHSLSLLLASAERLVKETKGEEILANC